jgi:uncharacterized protein YjbJ (UPF0337 family)
MATREQVMGNWNQLKGKIKEHWGQLTDNDFKSAEGDFDQIVGVIQRKTGQARSQIEKFLGDISEDAEDMLGQATERAREYASQAGERVREATQQVRDHARDGFEGAQMLVRRHPAEAVAVAFGTGLVVGIIVGLASRSR